MLKLEKALSDWVSQGIISPEQAKSISNYEATKSEGSWIPYGLLTLGAIIIGIGVISLIAANWYQISDNLKLVGNFILLSILAILLLKLVESNKKFLFEALLLLFMILCLASIGLISQIFHISGELYQTLMLWSIITFATVLASEQFLAPFIWVGVSLIAVVFATLELVLLHDIFKNNYQAVVMSIPLICASSAVLSKHLIGGLEFTRVFRTWLLISGLIALAVIELTRPARIIMHMHTALNSSQSGQLTSLIPYIPGYCLAVFITFWLWRSIEYSKTQRLLLFFMLGIFLVPFHLPLFAIIDKPIIYAIFTILVLGILAIFLASLRRQNLFQLVLIFLGLRFLILYFQALGGLATTGLGLIISGCVVIAMAILWGKYRIALAVGAERWIQ